MEQKKAHAIFGINFRIVKIYIYQLLKSGGEGGAVRVLFGDLNIKNSFISYNTAEVSFMLTYPFF